LAHTSRRPLVHELYCKATVQGTPFSRADELLADAKRRLSSGDLMHATHDEVEQFATAQGRLIVNALLRDHFALRGQAEALAPVVGADGQERTHVRHGAERTLVTTVGRCRCRGSRKTAAGCRRCTRRTPS